MRSKQEAAIVLGDDDLLGNISALRTGRRMYRARRSPARQMLGGTELLGRTFLERMASRTAGAIRTVSHQALNVGSKIPGYGSAVSMFRSATGGKTSDAAPKHTGKDKKDTPIWQNPMVLAGAGVLLLLLLKSKRGQGSQPIYYAAPPAPSAVPAR
jgi:hypothetical protein